MSSLKQAITIAVQQSKANPNQIILVVQQDPEFKKALLKYNLLEPEKNLENTSEND